MANLVLNVESNAIPTLSSIDRKINQTSSDAERLKRTFSSINFNSSNFKIPDLSGTINQLSRAAGATTAFIAAAFTYFTAVNSKFEQMQIMLTTATGSAKAGREEMDKLIQLATKAPFAVDALTDTFIKLKSSGIKDAYEYTVKLSDAIAAYGGNSDKLRLASIAIMQIVGKMKLGTEEVKRQLGEQIPTTIKILESELRKMGKLDVNMPLIEAMKKSLIDSDDALEALMKGYSMFSGAGERRMNSFQGSVQLLKTQFDLLTRDIGEANGSFSSITKAIMAGADMIDQFRNSAEGAAVVEKIANNIAEGFDKISDNPEIIYEFFVTVSEGAKLASSSLVDLIKILNAAMMAFDNLRPNGGVSDHSLSFLPDNFAMEQYSKYRPVLKEITELEAKVGNKSKISDMIGGDPRDYNSVISLWDTLTGKRGSAEDLDKNKKRLDELVEIVKNGGQELKKQSKERKTDANAIGEQSKALEELFKVEEGLSQSSDKEHNKTIKYIQTLKDKAKARYEEAIAGARTEEERTAATKKYEQTLKDIDEKEIRKSRIEGMKAERAGLRQLSAEIKNYENSARSALEVAREWNSEASSAVSNFNSMTEQLETAGMGEFELSLYNSNKALKEGYESVEEYQKSAATVNNTLSMLSKEYDGITSAVSKYRDELSKNGAGSSEEDINRLNNLINLQGDLKKQIEDVTKTYFELSDASGHATSSKQGVADLIANNLKKANFDRVYDEIGIASKEMFDEMINQTKKEHDSFIESGGDKVAAQIIFSQKIIDIERERAEYLAKKSGDYTALLSMGLVNYSKSLENGAVDFYENIFPEAIGSAGDAMGDFVKNVASSSMSISEAWSDMGESISDTIFEIAGDLTKLYIKMAMVGAINSSFGLSIPATGWHNGGSPSGDNPTFTRNLDFGSIPKYHTGLMGDEMLSILKRDESVLTPGQMSAIGRGFQEAKKSGSQNVSVVVNNNSTATATATAKPSKNGSSMEIMVEVMERKMQDRINRGKSGLTSPTVW